MGKAYDDAAIQFLECLEAEGLRWDRGAGCILAEDGRDIAPPRILEKQPTAQKEIRDLPPSADQLFQNTDRQQQDAGAQSTSRFVKTSVFIFLTVLSALSAYLWLSAKGWSRGERLTCIGLFFALASLVIPDVREFLRIRSKN